MRNRYYLPAIGRFISRDPAGLRAGVNPYIYAGDNPINFNDPTGMYFTGGTPPGGFDPGPGGGGGAGGGGAVGGDPGAPPPGSQGQQADTEEYSDLNLALQNGQGYYDGNASYGLQATGRGGAIGFGASSGFGPGVGGGPAHGPRLMVAQFSGYNYCGPGNNGGPTQPGTLDNSCKAHDQCYGQNGLSAGSVSIFPPGAGAGPAQRKCDKALCNCLENNALLSGPYDVMIMGGAAYLFCYH